MGRHIDFSEKSEKVVYKPKSSGTKRRRPDSVGRSVYKKTPPFSAENGQSDGETALDNKAKSTENVKNDDNIKSPEAAEKTKGERAKQATTEKTLEIKKEKKSRKHKKPTEKTEALPNPSDEEKGAAADPKDIKNGENPETPQPKEKAKAEEKSESVEKSEEKKPEMPFFFPLTLTVLAAVLVWGFFGGRAVSWTLLLLIPVVYSAQNAIKNKNANDFSLFTLTLFVYCFVGIKFGAWHPYWIVFAAVPLYHILVTLIKRAVSKQKNHRVGGDENTENQK